MLGEQKTSLEIVLGFWDQEVATQLEIVEKEFGSDKQDYIDIEVASKVSNNQKICSGPIQHINENVP